MRPMPVYPHNGILLSTMKERTIIDTHNNVDPSQNHYAERDKKPGKKKSRHHIIYLHKNSRKWKLIYNDREQITGCLKTSVSWGQEEGIMKGHKRKGERYITYLEGGDGFMDVHVCQN